MEDVLAVVLQIFFEMVLQFFGWMPLDFPRGQDRTDRGWVLLHACVGGFLGFLSALIAPTLLLPLAWLRIANLVVAPFAAGGLAYLFARWTRANTYDSRDHFWHGFLFALMFGAARFALARHRGARSKITQPPVAGSSTRRGRRGNRDETVKKL